MSIESMLVGLTRAGAQFVVIGGVAGTMHGSPFVTNDLDVCYATAPDNIRRLAELLREWQAYPRGWEQGLPFEMDARTFATTPILTLQTSQGQLDLLDSVAGVGTFEKVLEGSEEVAAFGIRVRALRLRELIAARRAAGRTRDLAQLPTLEALLELMKDPGATA